MTRDPFEQIRQQFKEALEEVRSCKELEQLKVSYLGRKGAVQELMQRLRSIAPEDRPLFGQLVNALKGEIENLCAQGLESLSRVELAERLAKAAVDVTLPGRCRHAGRMHPITQMMQEALDIARRMGFSVQVGPDIDSDFYNFAGLNFPPGHPARDMQDSFYVSSDYLLRTHTSNTQLRVMEAYTPPIRVVMPGTVYRNESISARAHVFFHQLEGMYIDKHVSFANLFATMEEFWRRLFRRDVGLRFRPSFFPFVEPGVEVDLLCTSCHGDGCGLCKCSGWLEVCGAGMIHPEVLRNGGIDPEKYTGYAWGMGIERLAMLHWGVKDIRLFAENDLRFLCQF